MPNAINENQNTVKNKGQWWHGKKNILLTKFPCALCGGCVNYTHHCPQITYFIGTKESKSTQGPPTPWGAWQFQERFPQPSHPTILHNPFPQQGVISTHQDSVPSTEKMGEYLNLGQSQPNNSSNGIIHVTSEDIHL
jgi:hypothetical protein